MLTLGPTADLLSAISTSPLSAAGCAVESTLSSVPAAAPLPPAAVVSSSSGGAKSDASDARGADSCVAQR